MLDGEILAKQGDLATGIARIERAVRLEDTLLYNEPPDWYFPVRHILGAMLMDAKQPSEAEAIYWEDLRRNPNNGFSLFGLQQALQAQGKDAIAKEVSERFEKAWRNSDVTLTSSRF